MTYLIVLNDSEKISSHSAIVAKSVIHGCLQHFDMYQKITCKIFEKTNINRHNAKRKYGTYAQKIVLTTYMIMQVAYNMVENAHKNNKNAQKEYLLWTHKMLICIKWQNYIHENYNNVTNRRMIHEFRYLAWQN